MRISSFASSGQGAREVLQFAIHARDHGIVRQAAAKRLRNFQRGSTLRRLLLASVRKRDGNVTHMSGNFSVAWGAVDLQPHARRLHCSVYEIDVAGCSSCPRLYCPPRRQRLSPTNFCSGSTELRRASLTKGNVRSPRFATKRQQTGAENS